MNRRIHIFIGNHHIKLIIPRVDRTVVLHIRGALKRNHPACRIDVKVIHIGVRNIAIFTINTPIIICSGGVIISLKIITIRSIKIQDLSFSLLHFDGVEIIDCFSNWPDEIGIISNWVDHHIHSNLHNIAIGIRDIDIKHIIIIGMRKRSVR